MSRGPGRWEQLLLDALAEIEGAVAVGGICWKHLGRKPTRSEEVAIRRAAKRLVEKGHARAIYRRLPRADEIGTTHQLVLTRPEIMMASDLIPLGHVPKWIDTRLAMHLVADEILARATPTEQMPE